MKNYLTPKNLGLVSLLLIFITDLLIPPGTAVCILYLASMAIVFNENRKIIIRFAFLSSTLLLLDIVINTIRIRAHVHYSVYADRFLSLGAIWLICFILNKYRRLNEEKSNQQEQLLKSEKMYHTLVDNLIEGAQIIGYDWKYKYLNNSAEKQSGFSREELLGSTMIEKYPGIEKTEMFKLLEQCMAERQPTVFENEFTYPDHSKGYFKLSVEPIEQGLFILSMDISESRKKEENQKRYTRELEEMLHITSHKVRQPVTHILGLSGLINSDMSTEEFKRIMNLMKDSAQNLDSFTAELTYFMSESRKKSQL